MNYSERFTEDLERKFGLGAKLPERPAYEITQDAGFLHQYFLLRENMFIKLWGGSPEFTGEKDKFDDRSEIMVARVGNHIVGGCRLTFDQPLPLEEDGFDLAAYVPQVAAGERFAEISRLAFLPEFQKSEIMLELCRRLLAYAMEKNTRYAFLAAPVGLIEDYQDAARFFGLEWQAVQSARLPEREEHDGIPRLLFMIDFAPATAAKTAGQTSLTAA